MFRSAVFVLLLVFAWPAYAQDQCKDALRDGTRYIDSAATNEIVKTAYLYRFTQLSWEKYQSEKTKWDQFVSPIAGWSGFQSSSELSEAQLSISEAFDFNQLVERSSETLISSGDSTILNAWTTCMLRQTGVLMWLRPTGADQKHAVLTLQYNRSQFGPTAVVVETINISGGEPVSPATIRRGTRLAHGKSVSVLINRTIGDGLLAVLNTGAGATDGFVPYLKPHKQVVRQCRAVTPSADLGHPWGRVTLDINKDGCVDFCRIVGDAGTFNVFYRCDMGSRGKDPQGLVNMTPMDGGYPGTQSWKDVNGDNFPDFCRFVGSAPGYEACLLNQGGQLVSLSVQPSGLPVK